MLWKILNKISGDYNLTQIIKTKPLVAKANEFFEKYKNFSHEQFVEKTNDLKEQFQKGRSLDDMLPEAFWTLKAAAYSLKWTKYSVKGYEYTWNMVPFDVQMIGWAILHSWKIAEMKTGEWKTLVATLPAYLNALSWKWVHIVTVNDYLVSFGAEQMAYLFNHMWISVWAVTKFTPIEARKREYEKDIVYVENTEIGFDYLRDNLAKSLEERVLVWRPLNFAIVDEVDSVLIDEARTPLIISQPSEEATEKYVYYARIVQSLIPSKNKKKVSKGFLADMLAEEKKPREDQWSDEWDYYIDEKLKTAILSSKWIEKLEKMLWVENLYKDFWYDEIHHIENALKALSVYHLDRDYIIQNWEILIVDEHTGRTMPGRRFSEWLHQAIEAKENVVIQRESKTLATITYQNFFKLYNKLAGMTWTASTEWEEFEKMYKLETVVIPTNRPTIRVDKNDSVYVNQNIKWKFVTDIIDFYHQMWVPLLIGTSSISTSEHVSSLLREYAIPHYVLNAKYHEQEAQIVASWWNFWSVIVATNMAGRWTDIKLQDWLNQKIALNYANYAKKMIERLEKLTFNIFTPVELGYTLEGLFEAGLIDEKDFQALQHWKSTKNISLIFWAKNNKNKKAASYYANLVFRWNKQGWNDMTRDVHYGLWVIGTEKHDARRIDNQLRGRSWRQWDAGFSKFYVALDDTIMKKMGWDQIQRVAMAMSWLLWAKDEINSLELNQPQFTSSIERSQRQLEGWYFSIRKNLFDYDSVIAKQRERIYAKRDEIIFWADKNESWIFDEIKRFIGEFVYENGENFRWAPEEFSSLIKETFDVDYSGSLHNKDLKHLVENLETKYEEKISSIENKQVLWDVLKRTYLGIIDKNWIDNIDDMQYLREKVSMYWYAQQEPLLIYKQQAFEKFNWLLSSIKKEILYWIFNTNFDYIDNQNQIIQLVDWNEENFIDRLQDASAWLKADEIQQAQELLKTFSWPSQASAQLEEQAKESFPSYKEWEYEIIEVDEKK